MQKPSNKKPYYFYFDALTHYVIKTNETELEELEFKQKPNETDILLSSILFKNELPNKLSSVAFIKALPQLGFQKKAISAKHFYAINELFKERDNQNIEEPYCGAVYRDVLVFYKERKITGIVKLCFSCGHHYIFGTKKNTSNFAQKGNFKKIQQLLNS